MLILHKNARNVRFVLFRKNSNISSHLFLSIVVDSEISERRGTTRNMNYDF